MYDMGTVFRSTLIRHYMLSIVSNLAKNRNHTFFTVDRKQRQFNKYHIKLDNK